MSLNYAFMTRMIKPWKIEWHQPCRKHGKEEKCTQILVGKQKELDQMKHLVIDGSMLAKYISME
jgi:hypothetical protein